MDQPIDPDPRFFNLVLVDVDRNEIRLEQSTPVRIPSSCTRVYIPMRQ
jgi:hypothetical protein